MFRKVLIDGHCLHHLLPPVKTLNIQLRPASHNCQLPICKYVLYKRSSLYVVFLTVINLYPLLVLFVVFFSIYLMFLLYVYTFTICSCHVVLKVYLLTYSGQCSCNYTVQLQCVACIRTSFAVKASGIQRTHRTTVTVSIIITDGTILTRIAQTFIFVCRKHKPKTHLVTVTCVIWHYLIIKTNFLNDTDFIIRMLYKYSYNYLMADGEHHITHSF